MTTQVPEGSTLVAERLDNHEPGDEDRFAHYAPKEQIAQAMVEGTPCRALCGKVWIPNRAPDKFPTCPECHEIFESLPHAPE